MHCKHMDTIDTNSTNNDITAFIRDSLAEVTELDEKWPNQSWCELLVLKSEAPGTCSKKETTAKPPNKNK
jgi:hypothetical protein